jgi:hypothetical protein
MDLDRMRKVLGDAQDLAEGVAEAYKVAAFQEIVRASLMEAPSRRASDSVPVTASTRRVAPAEIPESVNEVLALLKDKPHTDRFEAVIYHALKRDGREAIPTDEILAAYSVTRMSRPANPSDVIAKCARRGHVRPGGVSDGQKTWSLTGLGERHVESLLAEVQGLQT